MSDDDAARLAAERAALRERKLIRAGMVTSLFTLFVVLPGCVVTAALGAMLFDALGVPPLLGLIGGGVGGVAAGLSMAARLGRRWS